MKKGYVVISDVTYRENYDMVKVVFTEMRPIYIEHRHWEFGNWYIFGECDQFDVAIEGLPFPRYDIAFTKNNKGVIDFNFSKF